MTRQEYYQVMERMKVTYGDRAYPPERVDSIFSRVEFLNVGEFDQVVTDVISDCMTPPSISKIMEYLKSFHAKHASIRQRQHRDWILTLPMCKMCGNSGIVSARERSENRIRYTCAFNCLCAVGQRSHQPEMGTWNQEKYGALYEPLFWAGEFIATIKKPINEIASLVSKSIPIEREGESA